LKILLGNIYKTTDVVLNVGRHLPRVLATRLWRLAGKPWATDRKPLNAVFFVYHYFPSRFS
jgi:hypothetical protein